MKNSIVVVGHLSLDHIKTEQEEQDDVPGGAALYTSVAAATYGNVVYLLSTRCSDFVQQTLTDLQANGVDSNNVIPILGKQRRSFMEYTKSFERITHSHARQIWYDCTVEQSPRHLPKGSHSVIMLPPMLPAVQLAYAEWAKKQNMLVCADTSEYFAQNDAQSLISLLEVCDVFMPSDVELYMMFPDCNGDLAAICDRLGSTKLALVVIKRAEQGCIICDFSNQRRYVVGIRNTKVIDATGAGDSFNGGFISAWIETKDIIFSGKYAAALASVCIEQFSFSGVLNSTKEYISALSQQVTVEEI